MVSRILFPCFFIFIIYISLASSAHISAYNIVHSNGELFTYYGPQNEFPEGQRLVRCQEGLWIRYSEQNFGANGEGSTRINLGLNGFCMPSTMLPDNSMSARPGGVTIDYTTPSVTLFNREGLRGELFVVVQNLSSVPFPIQSMVTSLTNVVLFADENFEGDSYCADLNTHGSCEDNDVCVMFSPNHLVNPPWSPALAKSVSLGCSISRPRKSTENRRGPYMEESWGTE